MAKNAKPDGAAEQPAEAAAAPEPPAAAAAEEPEPRWFRFRPGGQDVRRAQIGASPRLSVEPGVAFEVSDKRRAERLAADPQFEEVAKP